MDCKLLSGSTGVCHDGACQQYQQGEIRANSCDADDLCEMNSMFSSGGTTIGSEYNPGNSNLNVFGIATLAPKSMWNTRPFVRIRTIPTGGGMDKLQLLLADGNTASPTITMGYGAGTAKIETLGNIELNIDVSGAFLKIRTLDSSKTNLVDRLLITGRDQGHTYIKTPLTLNTNAGNGNAYACFAPDGTLFRSSVPCTQAPL
jgi:hypothetical protein